MNQPLDLIILGPQGSGKGTQAALLKERLGFVLITTGEELRRIAKTDTDIGRKVNQSINVEGRLVADASLVAEMIKNRIMSVPLMTGIILDSFPRSIEQYELMKKFWPDTTRGGYKVIFIELAEDEAVRRLSKRMVCERCGAIYPSGDLEKCTKCGGRLVHRVDDHPVAIKKRLELFNSLTMPMLKMMEKDVEVVHVDGSPSIEEVHQEILKKLGLL